MNTQLKKRLLIGSIVIVAALVAAVAIAGSLGGVQSISVANACTTSYVNARVQVSGIVVDNSYSTEGGTAVFRIYDENSSGQELTVSYDGSLSSTFGNGVTAICTGTITQAGQLKAQELVTKCPSKYEETTQALSVQSFLSYGDEVLDKTVKVSGVICEGSLVQSSDATTFELIDAQSEATAGTQSEATANVLHAKLLSSMPNGIHEGASVVITGALNEQDTFVVTAIELGE